MASALLLLFGPVFRATTRRLRWSLERRRPHVRSTAQTTSRGASLTPSPGGARARGCANAIGPIEAVNWRKQKELGRSARVWVARHGRSCDAYRFDVVGVLVEGQRVRIRHIEDAFPLHLSA